jgi:hypothetical protein
MTLSDGWRTLPHHTPLQIKPRFEFSGAASFATFFSAKGAGFDVPPCFALEVFPRLSTATSSALLSCQNNRPLELENLKSPQHARPCIPVSNFLSLITMKICFRTDAKHPGEQSPHQPCSVNRMPPRSPLRLLRRGPHQTKTRPKDFLRRGAEACAPFASRTPSRGCARCNVTAQRPPLADNPSIPPIAHPALYSGLAEKIRTKTAQFPGISNRFWPKNRSYRKQGTKPLLTGTRIAFSGARILHSSLITSSWELAPAFSTDTTPAHSPTTLAPQTRVGSTLSAHPKTQAGNCGSGFSPAEEYTEANSSSNFKRVLRLFPLLSILGLSACFGSALSNLFVTSTKLTPANPSIAVAGTQQFTLSVTFVDGTTDHENPNDTDWSSDTTAVATINKSGVATGVAPGTATIHGSFQGNNAQTILTVTTAQPAIAVHGDSRTLHVTNLRTQQELTFTANRSNDSIAVASGSESEIANDSDTAAGAEFSVLPERGPAWLAIAPSGNFLYVVNHASESVSAFAIDWQTGALAPVAGSPFRAGAKPWSVEVDPDGAGLSVAHLEDKEISRFRIDPATGALAPEAQ